MASLNKVMAIGNLCADVEVRAVGSSQVGRVNLAVSERFKKADGTVGEQTEYISLDIWDRPQVYPYLTKGASVYIEGALRTESWTDQSGAKRSTTKVRVQTLQLLGPRPAQAARPAQPAAPAAPTAPAYAPPAPAAPAAPAYQAPPAPAPAYAAPAAPAAPATSPYDPQPGDLPF